MGLSKEKEKTK